MFNFPSCSHSYIQTNIYNSIPPSFSVFFSLCLSLSFSRYNLFQKGNETRLILSMTLLHCVENRKWTPFNPNTKSIFILHNVLLYIPYICNIYWPALIINFCLIFFMQINLFFWITLPLLTSLAIVEWGFLNNQPPWHVVNDSPAKLLVRWASGYVQLCLVLFHFMSCLSHCEEFTRLEAWMVMLYSSSSVHSHCFFSSDT